LYSNEGVEMPDYAVTIKATVIKTIMVEADDEDKATELAHQTFTVEPEDCESAEKYDEETIACKMAD
jgi:hypothetical protein